MKPTAPIESIDKLFFYKSYKFYNIKIYSLELFNHLLKTFRVKKCLKLFSFRHSNIETLGSIISHGTS